MDFLNPLKTWQRALAFVRSHPLAAALIALLVLIVPPFSAVLYNLQGFVGADTWVGKLVGRLLDWWQGQRAEGRRVGLWVAGALSLSGPLGLPFALYFAADEWKQARVTAAPLTVKDTSAPTDGLSWQDLWDEEWQRITAGLG